MGRVAFFFPGQGSQSVGMGRAIAAAFPAAAAVFAEADAVLGEPLSRMAWEGPAHELDRTVNAQPAILAAAIATLVALRERWGDGGVTVSPAFDAGHSMGQYPAMVAAGSISLADGLRLVRERGRQMQAAGAGRAGAMVAIMGLDDACLAELVRRAALVGIFGVANRNAPGQVVVSGERPAVEASIEIARELGARKTVLLPVSVAAHSPLMAEAAKGMAEVIRDIPFADPQPPLVSNADGHLIVDAAGARAELVNHLTVGVDWVTAVRGMARTGVDVFLEVGPGRVLTGLIKRIEPEAWAIASNDPTAASGLATAALELNPATFAARLGR